LKSARAFLTAALMRKESFVGRSIEEATRDYFSSPGLAARSKGIECEYTSSLIADGVIQVRFTSCLRGLTDRFALKHKYSFPLLQEVRETGLVLDPFCSVGTSEIVIAMKDSKRGYFNITVHDDENYMIACNVLTYDRRGRVEPYTPIFPDKFVSPLQLGHSSLGEAVDDQGRRVLRLVLELKQLSKRTTIKVGYNATGIHDVRVFEVNPSSPVVTSDLLLDDNADLLPGDWVVGVTDEADRLLVNGVVQVEPVRAAQPKAVSEPPTERLPLWLQASIAERSPT